MDLIKCLLFILRTVIKHDKHSIEEKTDMHFLSVNVMGWVDSIFIDKTKFTWVISLSFELS